MFVDASAMIAIIAGEPEGASLAARLGQAVRPRTSPLALYEAVVSLARARACPIDEAASLVRGFIEEAGCDVVPVDATIAQSAIQAFARFGTGRHPAGLNMGDCFAYACATAAGSPLLFKGDDFTRTDIEVA